MSNNNNNNSNKEGEETVIRSKLKIKIKLKSSSALATSSQMDGQDEPLMNNELLQETEKNILDQNNPSLSSLGKRKKKPINMHGECVSDLGKRMKKQKESNHGPKSSRGRNRSNPDDETTPAMVRAKEIQDTLNSELPSLLKLMKKSHVHSSFWMGIPGYFCREHLPRMDSTVTLVDENGTEFQLNFRAQKMGLSAGWRKFTIDKKLLEDDVLILHLVEPCKFKVYIARANDFNEVEGALSLLNLEAQIKQNDKERDSEEGKSKSICVSTYKCRSPKSLQATPIKSTKPGKSVRKTLQLALSWENGSNSTHPSSYCSPNFKNLEKFEDFDAELPEDIRIKYDDLCSSRNYFLHANLGVDLNSKLIAGMICETVNISDAIKHCSLMTSEGEFENWDKTLKSFELLGMTVGFLRDRIKRLVRLAFESEGALETRKYVEAKMGRVRADDEIVNLETKLIELKEATEKYNADIEALKFKAESYELKFQKEVDAPWGTTAT